MTNATTHYDSYHDGFWQFLVDNLPNYYNRDDVLEDDILFRFLTDDDLCEEDLQWIEEAFHSDKELVRQRLVELETGFAREALDSVQCTMYSVQWDGCRGWFGK